MCASKFINPHLHVPVPGRIMEIVELGPKEKLFRIALNLGHVPGQFVMVKVPFRDGEAAISISSSPTDQDRFELAIRMIEGGMITPALFELKPGAIMFIRGPFGRGFPLETLEGRDLMIVAGGTGLFPLRSLIRYVLAHRRLFGKIYILFGTSIGERFFPEEMDTWAADPSIVYRTGRTRPGKLDSLSFAADIDPTNAAAVVVGPPGAFFEYVIDQMQVLGIPEHLIFQSIERRMRCGVGKCGHCMAGGYLVCVDGPVFPYSKVRRTTEGVLS